MLETAFHKTILSALPKAEVDARTKTRNKEWSYIGRFIVGFALIEYQVNQLFEDLMTPHRPLPEGGWQVGHSAAGHWLAYTLDLRKKLKVLELILESRGVDESATFKVVHSLHDLRNVVAHWPVLGVERDGLSYDYTKAEGGTEFQKPKTKDRDNVIKFAEFDYYDVLMSEIYEKFEKFSMFAPIADVEEELQIAIEEAISTSENVVRFPNKLPRREEGKE